MNPQNPQQSPQYNQDQQNQQPQQVVYVTRPHEPMQPELSAEQLKRHEESKQKHPDLNLSKGEFIISAVDRHPIGLLQIWAVVGVVIAAIFAVAVFVANELKASNSTMSPEIMAIPAILISALALLFGFIATSIYNANKFFLTNESVIQQIQTGLFAKREQTVSLNNIEDASYQQHGVLPHLLDYGLLRLSTEGDETTYRFSYASRPQRQIAVLNNAVEAFKNGRPVTGENDD